MSTRTSKSAGPEAPGRRKIVYVRPYLVQAELGAIVAALEDSAQTPDGGLLDPSLSAAIAELKRWL